MASRRRPLIGTHGRVLAEVEERRATPDPVDGTARRIGAPTADRMLRLSRFTVVHAVDGALVAESPVATVRVHLIDPAAAVVVAALAAPRPFSELVGLGGRAGWGITDVRGLVDELEAGGLVVPDGAEDDDPRTVVRDVADAWFHASSRGGHAWGPLGTTWRGRHAGVPAPAVVADRRVVRWLDLPEPPAGAPASLPDLAYRRRSCRTFDPLGRAELAAVLGPTLRIEAVHAVDDWEVSRRGSPSGGATHDLDALVVIGRSDDVPAGVWWYDPAGHRLGDLGVLGVDAARSLIDAGAAMGGVEPPPSLIVLTARFGRTAWKYEGIAYALTLKNAGVVIGMLSLLAEAVGLGSCAIGPGDSARVEGWLGVHPLEESSVAEIAIGRPRR